MKGIGGSDAVLFVLSPTSVDRPWVREELSASVIRRLHECTRLVPILIDGLPDDQVPIALRHIKWIRVEPGDSSVQVATEIASALHADGQPNPEVAPPPSWTTIPLSGKLGLTAQDEVLFAFACHLRLQSDNVLVNFGEMFAFAAEHGIERDYVVTAIAMFRRYYYIEEPPARGGLPPNAIRLTKLGLESYLRSCELERFEKAAEETVAAIVNGRASNLAQLTKLVSESSRAVLELYIQLLEAQRELLCSWGAGGSVAWSAQKSLKRRLESRRWFG
jgi:hypothetical protein